MACIVPECVDISRPCKDCEFNVDVTREVKSLTEFEKMKRLLKYSWYLKGQIVPCLVGPPGIGKTAAVKEHAEEHDSKVVKIVASRCVPSETVGMTMPDHENHTMAIYNSMQLSSLRDGDVLFLDELLEADQFVLSTMLTLIESREMADGTPLPDIQIVAATNDTISPEQLKPNIRQRFMFERFRVDREQTRDYILSVTGFDVPSHILGYLCENGTDYNFLTPRSLTKLCVWMSEVPEDETEGLAGVINSVWTSTLGTELLALRKNRDSKLLSPEGQVKCTVKEILDDLHVDKALDFENSTIGEILEMLQGLEEWGDIERILANREIFEPDVEEADVKIDF